MDSFWLALGAAWLAVIYAFYNMRWVLARPSGSEQMVQIAGSIQEGARAYLNRQYRVVALIAVVLVIGLAASFGPTTAIGFSVGAVFSALSGYLGMYVAVRANVRTGQAAK